jgi:hypothetical protein
MSCEATIRSGLSLPRTHLSHSLFISPLMVDFDHVPVPAISVTWFCQNG